MTNLALFSAWFIFSENEQTQACENENWFTFYSLWAHLFQVYFFWDVQETALLSSCGNFFLKNQVKETWNENAPGWLVSHPELHLLPSRENQASICKTVAAWRVTWLSSPFLNWIHSILRILFKILHMDIYIERDPYIISLNNSKQKWYN